MSVHPRVHPVNGRSNFWLGYICFLVKHGIQIDSAYILLRRTAGEGVTASHMKYR